MIKPDNFDGAKFAAKYNLDPFRDFYDNGNGEIVCPSMPDLVDADLLDCLADPLPDKEIFSRPIQAPAVYAEDIYVSSRDIKNDPLEALAESLTETKKGRGEPKSIDLIARSNALALEHAMKEIYKLRLDVEQLKKKVK